MVSTPFLEKGQKVNSVGSAGRTVSATQGGEGLGRPVTERAWLGSQDTRRRTTGGTPDLAQGPQFALDQDKPWTRLLCEQPFALITEQQSCQAGQCGAAGRKQHCGRQQCSFLTPCLPGWKAKPGGRPPRPAPRSSLTGWPPLLPLRAQLQEAAAVSARPPASCLRCRDQTGRGRRQSLEARIARRFQSIHLFYGVFRFQRATARQAAVSSPSGTLKRCPRPNNVQNSGLSTPGVATIQP